MYLIRIYTKRQEKKREKCSNFSNHKIRSKYCRAIALLSVELGRCYAIWINIYVVCDACLRTNNVKNEFKQHTCDHKCKSNIIFKIVNVCVVSFGFLEKNTCQQYIKLNSLASSHKSLRFFFHHEIDVCLKFSEQNVIHVRNEKENCELISKDAANIYRGYFIEH